MKKTRRPSVVQLEKQITEWNRDHKVGEEVAVTLDDGTSLVTKTRSAAWVMGEHSAMILVDGISGAFSLNRVKPTVRRD